MIDVIIRLLGLAVSLAGSVIVLAMSIGGYEPDMRIVAYMAAVAMTLGGGARARVRSQEKKP